MRKYAIVWTKRNRPPDVEIVEGENIPHVRIYVNMRRLAQDWRNPSYICRVTKTDLPTPIREAIDRELKKPSEVGHREITWRTRTKS